jgi:hypothetical protein
VDRAALGAEPNPGSPRPGGRVDLKNIQYRIDSHKSVLDPVHFLKARPGSLDKLSLLFTFIYKEPSTAIQK